MKQRIQIASESDPTKFHVVELNDNGRHRCSCKGWIFKYQKLGQNCKHIEMALNMPQVSAARVAPVPSKSEKRRVPRGEANTLLRRYLLPILKRWTSNYEVCGSYRRGSSLIGDLDIVVSCEDKAWAKVVARFDELGRSISGGMQKASFVIATIQVDLNRVRDIEWGAALCHYTGSMEENIRLREIAKRKGYTLNQYGFSKNGKIVKHCQMEEEVYRFLNQPYKRPQERNAA